jgi:serine/threonine protein kinase
VVERRHQHAGGRGVPADRVLDQRFRLLDEIGRGGMSTVYRAQDLADGNRLVAVKVPLPVFSSGVGAWSIFQREEEIGRALDHPSILRFLAPTTARRSYVVTEYVPGVTLYQHLRAHGAEAEPRAIDIARRLCGAVEHIHERGFVHYDIKPGNVILGDDGTIRLIDLGLAHAARTSRFSLSGPPPAIGSSDYVAPEQIRRRRGRKSADVYALGAILYELLTGQSPFPGDDPFVVASARTLGDPPAPRSINPRVSRQAEEIALRALQRHPSRRYASAAEMRRDLEHPERVVVSGLAERLQPVTRARRIARICRHIFMVAVLPVAAQVLIFLALWHHHSHRR